MRKPQVRTSGGAIPPRILQVLLTIDVYSRRDRTPRVAMARRSGAGVGSCLAPPPALNWRIASLAPLDGPRAFVAYLASLGFELYGPTGSAGVNWAPASGGGAITCLTAGT